MTGPTGFVQRYKGKIAAAEIYMPTGAMVIGGTQMNAAAADLNANLGLGTAFTSTGSTTNLSTNFITGAAGIKQIIPGTSSVVWQLPAPTLNEWLLLDYSTVNGSTLVFFRASTAGAITIQGVGSTGSTASFAGSGGSTLSNTIKSTQSCQIELVGLSTSAWLFTGVVPSTSGHLTFSTTT